MIYLDTSVLVAYYLPERLSALAQQRLLRATNVVISELVQTEFVFALSLRYRIGDLILALEPPYFRCIGRERWWTPLRYYWLEAVSGNFGRL